MIFDRWCVAKDCLSGRRRGCVHGVRPEAGACEILTFTPFFCINLDCYGVLLLSEKGSEQGEREPSNKWSAHSYLAPPSLSVGQSLVIAPVYGAGDVFEAALRRGQPSLKVVPVSHLQAPYQMHVNDDEKKFK